MNSTCARVALAPLVVLALFSSCSVVHRGQSEAQGGARWLELKSTHFVVETDLPEAEARQASDTLERTRAEIATAMGAPSLTSAPDDVRVTVLSDGVEFQDIFNRNVAGLFHHTYPPRVVIYGHPDSWEKTVGLGGPRFSVLRHELTHHLSVKALARQPRWFAEGLASFFETLERSPDGHSVILGKPNVPRLSGYHSVRSITVRDALNWEQLTFDNEGKLQGLYGLSWLMVHWLYNTHPTELAAFQQRLAAGEDPRRAWTEVFPDLAPEELDRQLEGYARHGDYQELSVPVPPVASTPEVRALSSADADAIRAELWAMGIGYGQPQLKLTRAHEYVDSALKQDPGDVRALRVAVALTKPDERRALARRATAAHPEDGRAWLLLGALLDRPDEAQEKEAALQKAVQLAPEDAEAANALAWFDVNQGHGSQALPLAVRAAREAPGDAAIADTLAAAYAETHQCKKAIATEEQAIALLPDGTPEKARAQFAHRLDQLRSDCH